MSDLRQSLSAASRPRFRVGCVNVNFAQGVEGGAASLRRAARHADVLGGVEMKFIPVRRVLDPAVWDTVQLDHGLARRGSMFAIRRRVGRVINVEHSVGTRPGRAAMLTRYFLVVTVELVSGHRVRFIVGHFPPARFPWLWPGMARRLRDLTSESALPTVVICDWNRVARLVKRATGLRWRGVGILGFAYTPGVHLTRAWAQAVGSDHPLVLTDCTPLLDRPRAGSGGGRA